MKTSELTGAALDWAVAKIEANVWGYFSPSTNWTHGGPIIEREGMQIQTFMDKWLASIPKPFVQRDGPTPLIAAMRCYVASKLGDDIEIPKELTE
jgi:hypothetical protein